MVQCMPKPPVPPDVDEFLSRPNPAVIGSIRPDGSPHTAPTWYDWEGGRILVNMDASRRRLDYLRQNPRVSLTVLDKDSWYRHVTVEGRVVSLEQDPDAGVIDRMSRRYSGEAYSQRDQTRWSAWIEVDAWHGWVGGSPWPGSAKAA
jgi:PPOX class probable F420-dependent enzyme